MSGFYDTAANFHPYECDGAGKCKHCDRVTTPDHDPATCALCDPEYDFRPNPQREALRATSTTSPDREQQGVLGADSGGKP